jgi:predicted amidohydrolase
MQPNLLHVAAVQMKFRPTMQGNLETIRKYIDTASRDGVQAVLFPECAITGYRRNFSDLEPDCVDEACKTVAAAARRSRLMVLIGAPVFRQGRWYNALLVFDRRGRKIHEYAKIHLTPWDARFFARGNALALFPLPGGRATAIICHERRYPELVRLPVMLGARIIFHPNAGLDTLEVSRTKRGGRDGIAVRAFENQVFYVFANSVGRQGAGLWSAGDSKIVGPDSRVLAQANNSDETMIQARVDLAQAGRRYAREALRYPAFLRPAWKQVLMACRNQSRRSKSSV